MRVIWMSLGLLDRVKKLVPQVTPEPYRETQQLQHNDTLTQ